jgi:ABC-type sugar transport system ATPase subunit
MWRELHFCCRELQRKHISTSYFGDPSESVSGGEQQKVLMGAVDFTVKEVKVTEIAG